MDHQLPKRLSVKPLGPVGAGPLPAHLSQPGFGRPPGSPERLQIKTKYKRERPTVGVLVGWQAYEGILHTFFEPLFRGIQSAARDRDCNLLLACGVGRGAGPGSIYPAWPVLSPESDFVPVGPWNTDGLIVATPLISETRSRDIQNFRAAGHPVVFVGAGEDGPTVMPDNESGVQQALTHLIQHGHRRIAFIAGGQDERNDSDYRLAAYRAATREFGLEADPRLVAYGWNHQPGGSRAMQQLLASGCPFTAVLTSNDES